jgi:hypothetical protein
LPLPLKELSMSAASLLALWILLAPVQPAADPAELELRVQALVRQLDDRDPARRTAAEKELLEIGPAVLPHLPADQPNTAAEVRERLARVRGALQQAAAEQALRPSKLTLEGEMPLADVWAEIEKQTGNKIVDYREQFGEQPSERTVSLKLNQVDFWPALDQVLDQAGLTHYGFVGQQRTLGVVGQANGQRPRAEEASYQGLFRIAAT